MEIWQIIGRDHAIIEQSIHDAPRALNGPGVVRNRERILGDLIDDLETHAEALEVSLYDALGAKPEMRTLVTELRDGHRVFMRQLDGLRQRRRHGSDGWLDTFEDATFLVDQHIHRTKHELVPRAAMLLSPDEVAEVTRAFVRAKTRRLKARHHAPSGGSASRELRLGIFVSVAAAGLGYLLWQAGFLGGSGRRPKAGARAGDGRRGVNPRTAPVPAGHGAGETARQRTERMLDEGLEDTFPASDPVPAQRFT